MEWERVVSPRGTPVVRGGPASASVGVVLLGDGADGEEALRMYAARLVSRGCRVVMPDLWWRVLSSTQNVGLSDPEALRDVAAARSLLGVSPPSRCFVMGFGLGGPLARMSACALPGFAGAVVFQGRIQYPAIDIARPLQPLDLLPGLSCPLQCHFGGADPATPPAHVDELERRLALRSQPTQVFRYPRCGSAFLDPGAESFCAPEADTAWARACNFLDQLSR